MDAFSPTFEARIKPFEKRSKALKPEDWDAASKIQSDMVRTLSKEDCLMIGGARRGKVSELALAGLCRQVDLDSVILEKLARLAQDEQQSDPVVWLAAGRLTGLGPRKGKVDLPDALLYRTFDAADRRLYCRAVAISGFASLGLTEAESPRVDRWLQDANAEVRKQAIEALTHLSLEETRTWVVPRLIQGLAKTQGDALVLCANALQARQAQDALPALIRALEELAERQAFRYDQAAPLCAVGNAIVALAKRKGPSFEQRRESFHSGNAGGWRFVDQTEEFRANTLAILDWWRREGRKAFMAPDPNAVSPSTDTKQTR